MDNDQPYLLRVASAVGLVTLVVVTLFVVWKASVVFLLAFAGVLLAVVLTSLSRPLERRLGVPYRLALMISLLLTVAVLVAVAWTVGPRLGDQLNQLGSQMPGTLESLRERAAQNPLAGWLLERLPVLSDPAEAGAAEGALEGAPSSAPEGAPEGGDLELVGRLTSLFGGVLSTFAGLFFVLFCGIFLAADPGGYVSGIVHLFPRPRQSKVREVFDTLGATLRGWLLGQFLSMVVVGVLVGIALMVVGMPLALALAFLAFLFEFIPTVGPWIAALPAVLLALTESPNKALLVAGIYLVIELVEGNLIHPLAQLRTVDLPPFVTLVAIFLMERLFGFAGILVASPLAAIVMVLIRELYMRDRLGEEVELPGE